MTRTVVFPAICLIMMSLIMTRAEAADGKRYALIVGVDSYRVGQNLGDLPFTENDAKELAETLEAGGYQVTLMTNSVGRIKGKEQFAPLSDFIRDQLDAMLDNPFLTDKDVVIVALSGHGIQFDLINGTGENLKPKQKFYFCPGDAAVAKVKTANEISDRNNLLDLDELYAALDKCKAGGKLLLVDACRNDPTKPKSTRETLASETMPPVSPPPGGIAAFFSCSADQKAHEDADLKHGVFFHHVIEALKGDADSSTAKRKADGQITLAELSEHVSSNTYDYVRTKFNGAKQAPELKGEFRLTIPLIAVAKNRNLPTDLTNSNGMKQNLLPPTTVNVKFVGQDGMSIGWIKDDTIYRHQRFVPGRADFVAGTTTRLVFENIPGDGWEGVSLYPTLQIEKISDQTATTVESSVALLELTDEDLEYIRSNQLVTKVLYLPKPEFRSRPLIGVETAGTIMTLSSTHLESGEDPIESAKRMGTIVAVFNIGNREVDFEGMKEATPTVQVKFVGQDGMSIGWIKDDTIYRNQRFVPGRADFVAGTTTRLVFENIPGDGWEGVSLYPTLQIEKISDQTATTVESSVALLELTDEDLEYIRSNQLVTKVLYLPKPEFRSRPLIGVETAGTIMTLSSTHLESGEDPIESAKRMGTIVAVFSISNRRIDGKGLKEATQVHD